MCWVAQLGLFYLMYNTTALNPPPNWPDDIEGTFGIKLPRTASKENLVSSSRKGKSTSLNPDHEELSFSDSGDEEKSYLGGNAPLIKGSTTVTGTEFELGHGTREGVLMGSPRRGRKCVESMPSTHEWLVCEWPEAAPGQPRTPLRPTGVSLYLILDTFSCKAGV